MPIFDHEAPAARGVTAKNQSHARSVSRGTAFVLVFAVGVPLGHGVVPWAISRLSPWYGWEAGAPGIWNLGTRRHAIRERPWQLTSRR